MESLEADLKFIEEVIGLPPAWEVLQEIMAKNPIELKKQDRAAANPISKRRTRRSAAVILANVSKRDFTYSEYMSQLSEFEINLLYTAYFHDFEVFGYDPCKDL